MNRLQNSFGISFIIHVLLLAAILNMGNWDFPAPKLVLDFSVLSEKTATSPLPVFSKPKPMESKKKLPQPKIEQPKIEEKPVPPPPEPKEVIPEPIPKKIPPPPPPPPKIEVKPRLPPETIEEKPLEITKKRELQAEDTKLDKIETKRRMMEETQLNTLSKQTIRKVDELDSLKQLGNTRSRTFDDVSTSPRIQAVQSRNDVTMNNPTVFYSAKPTKRVADEPSSPISGLSSAGGRQRQDDTQSRTNLKVASSSTRTSQASLAGEDNKLKIGVTKRTASVVDIEKVNLNVELPKREATIESEPLKIPAVPTKADTKENTRTEDAFQNTWQRVDNIGPLAHLNARCYNKQNGSIVVAGQYKFKCSNNQIIEAWKQIPNL